MNLAITIGASLAPRLRSIRRRESAQLELGSCTDSRTQRLESASQTRRSSEQEERNKMANKWSRNEQQITHVSCHDWRGVMPPPSLPQES